VAQVPDDRSAQLNTLIQVDGGITDRNAAPHLPAGARVFVAATAIFKHPQGIAAGVRALRAIFKTKITAVRRDSCRKTR
jgi:pentose-5-phosphate-3-epimerase